MIAAVFVWHGGDVCVWRRICVYVYEREEREIYIHTSVFYVLVFASLIAAHDFYSWYNGLRWYNGLTVALRF